MGQPERRLCSDSDVWSDGTTRRAIMAAQTPEEVNPQLIEAINRKLRETQPAQKLHPILEP